ncbi:actin-binding protein IPP-like [Lytechinus pictus]|uniref:actin-binding protein IPP-like n=1 Tax=Lytechinus pictus TaxID=7653 RepID=UPI0030B9FC77
MAETTDHKGKGIELPVAMDSSRDSEDGKRVYSCRSALSKKLLPFFINEELTDIHIKVGGRKFAAHRVVLGSWSDELRSLLETASSDNIIELASSATDKEIAVFEMVLNFLYTGEVSFSSTNVRMVMSLAKQLGLKKLSEMAQEWVGEMINQGSMVGAITWLRDAAECDYLSVKNDCLRTLSLYFQYIPESSWLGLTLEELCSILERDDLVADNELEIIARVDDWLKAKGSIEGNKDLYLKIVPKIRFSFVKVSELSNIQETSAIVKFASEYCPATLSESYKYRALSYEAGVRGQYDAGSNTGNPRAGYDSLKKPDLQPRLYLNFMPPGLTTRLYGRSQRQNDGFREVSVDQYRTEMTCAVRDETGAWSLESESRYFKFVLKFETTNIGDSEAWAVKYEIDSTDSPRSDSRYRMVLVTRPHDKDSDFYLPENPIVMTKEGSLNNSRAQNPSATFSVTTPPVFAGRKPRRVEVAAIVYMIR